MALLTSIGHGPAGAAAPPAEYQWSQLGIGAGGFVTGIVAARPDGGATKYVRTDVGGAYRWEPDADRWQQLFRADRFPASDPLGVDDYSVASIAVAPSDGDVVYAAVGADFPPRTPDEAVVGTGRILRSTDGGQSWVPTEQRWFIHGNGRYRTGAEHLAVDPSDPRHVLFGSQREGLWRSTDGGERWTQIDGALVPFGQSDDLTATQAGISFTSIVEADGATAMFAGVSHHGVLASRDNGATWQTVHPLVAGEVAGGPAVSEGAIFVTVNDVDNRRSEILRIDLDDLAVTVIEVPVGNEWIHVAVDPVDDQRLVLSLSAVYGDNRLWSSRDGGVTWRPHGVAIVSPEIPWLERTDLLEHLSVGAFLFDPVDRQTVWFAEGMAVWRTQSFDDDTVVWESEARGIEETVVNAILPRPDGSVLVAVSDRQGFALRVDGDLPAATLIDERFVSGTSLDASGTDPDVVAWAGGQSHLGTSPARAPRGAVSNDGGASWTEMTGMIREQFAGEIAVSATDPSRLVWMPTAYESPRLLADEPVGIYVSADGGRSWQRRSIDGRDASFHRLYSWTARRSLAADRVNGDFYALSDEEQFFVSADGGESWERAAFAPPCLAISDCHVFGQVQAIPGRPGALFASVAGEGLYRTGDAGASPWVRVEQVVEARAFGFGRPGPSGEPTLFVHGRLQGDERLALLRSDDLGRSWTVITDVPGGYATQINAVAGDLAVDGRVYVGFAGTGAVVGDVGT